MADSIETKMKALFTELPPTGLGTGWADVGIDPGVHYGLHTIASEGSATDVIVAFRKVFEILEGVDEVRAALEKAGDEGDLDKVAAKKLMTVPEYIENEVQKSAAKAHVKADILFSCTWAMIHYWHVGTEYEHTRRTD